jgi:hypothetical protein
LAIDSLKISSLSQQLTEGNTNSLFENHLLQVKNTTPLLHVTQYDYVIFSVLLVLFSIFVWLYVYNNKVLQKTIQDFLQFRITSRRLVDTTGVRNRASFFLTFFFVVTLSILFGELLKYYNINLFKTTIPNELIIGISIVVIYLLKLLVIKIIGTIFKMQNEAEEYILQIISYLNVVGLFLFPIIILLSFFKAAPPVVFIYAGLITIVSFLGVRSLNGILLGLNSAKISKFYLFIYLCALEILPFIVIAKLIILRIK